MLGVPYGMPETELRLSTCKQAPYLLFSNIGKALRKIWPTTNFGIQNLAGESMKAKLFHVTYCVIY